MAGCSCQVELTTVLRARTCGLPRPFRKSSFLSVESVHHRTARYQKTTPSCSARSARTRSAKCWTTYGSASPSEARNRRALRCAKFVSNILYQHIYFLLIWPLSLISLYHFFVAHEQEPIRRGFIQVRRRPFRNWHGMVRVYYFNYYFSFNFIYSFATHTISFCTVFPF